MRNLFQYVRLFLALFIIVILGSCRPEKEQLAKTWFFTLENRKSTGARKDPVLTPANFIHLQQNGQYSSDLVSFETGTWMVNNGSIELQSSQKKVQKLRIINSSAKELALDIRPDNTDDCQMLFTGIADPFPDPKENPFHVSNNQWRMAPLKKESDTALRHRILNYFQYWERYFAWALEAKINYLDVRSLKGPIKIYGNGFALVPFEELNAEWHTHFYDLDDSRKAYDQIETMLKQETISWPNTDNKFKAFISAFQQAQNFLNKK